ncbi:MAG TPA: HAMP domain-containing sensor histidine kinase, partial [Longimicrobiales bacterium]|nr:HAMP domain-containing sensor histidine kinase [Longimicrobiales bacterium]
GTAVMRLTLVPATAPAGLPPEGVRWHATDEGWRSEALVPYPDGPYHAHLEVHIAPLAVRLARGALLLGLMLAALALLWLLGRVAGGEPPAPRAGWRPWVGSFRARVTLALLAFFLAPTFAFGALSYRSLAGEVVRTAALLAERSAGQAVARFEAAEGELPLLAQLTETDVLFYHRGELLASSAPEAFDLGLYGAWMPPSAWLALESGEELMVTQSRRLLGQPHVVAYARMRPAGTLAVPVSVAGGEAAVRQRELAHLVLFAALLGALLSLALSLAVGRSLTHPIGQLRRAAGAVGAGRLEARLPEGRTDEFGELFGSFNRMTRQLRRARGRELRAARVLAWGEMARQVAHEIKNPLTPIKLSVQHRRRAHADRRADFGEILDANVEQILGEIDRLSDIARAFSRYGAPPEAAGPLEGVDVEATVRETLALYRSGETGVRYPSRIEGPLPRAAARTGELKEVLVNLLENARAAVGAQGRVEVSAAVEGERIRLQVSDDGEGIPAELLPRVFEPQFSTRSAGTGLGLAIVRRLIESWGGDVAVESQVGGGTTVTVWLPLAEPEQAKAGGRPSSPEKEEET